MAPPAPDSPSPEAPPAAEPVGLQRTTPGLALVLLVLVSAAASLALTRGLTAQAVPELQPSDVGKPFQSASPAGLKAARDYDVLDRARTEARRLEARSSVLPVYDYNPGVLAEQRQTLHEAFAELRAALGRLEPDVRAGLRTRRPGAAETPSLGLLAAREALEKRLFVLEDEDFQALLQARASRESEDATEALLQHAYLAPVVASREELGSASALAARQLGEGVERMTSPAAPAVLDVREARAEVERFASLPGNLLPDAPAALRRAVLRLAKRLVRPDLTVNTAETEARRTAAALAVKDAIIQVKRGQKVIGDGDLVTEDHLHLLEAMRAQSDQLDRVQVQLGAMAVVALLLWAAWSFQRRAFGQRRRPSRRDALLLGVVLVGLLGCCRLWMLVAEALHDRSGRIPLEALYAVMPVAAGAMLVRFVLDARAALFFALVASCLLGVMLGNSVPWAVFALVGSLVAADHIGRAKDRAGIFRAGLAVGLASAAVLAAFALADGKGTLQDTVVTAGFALVGTAITVPMTVLALTPLLELVFGYASDLKLLELANLNHPALKELIVRSPGTYHHSILVGSLVEAAAEEIGCNPLLARTCAYYHDIGKGKNPLYFGENQKGENPHDCLAPAMSAVIIKRHVTDGLELARQYRLPRAVVDVIAQHHGSRLVGYFHHKALRELEQREGGPALDEAIYRYPGPKPQFREAALVMVADAVEAASRAMPDPTSEELQALVQRIINVVFSEGQLDECDLTLRDLNVLARSFLHTLEGIYHARPEYPPGAVGGPRPQQLGLASVVAETRRASGTPPPRRP
ncbi:MAG: HD family phosphohydrolase [Myxococcaceae bacterium]